jgi:hypothetical protein
MRAVKRSWLAGFWDSAATITARMRPSIICGLSRVRAVPRVGFGGCRARCRVSSCNSYNDEVARRYRGIGKQMPANGPPFFTADQIASIAEWIDRFSPQLVQDRGMQTLHSRSSAQSKRTGVFGCAFAPQRGLVEFRDPGRRQYRSRA